MESPDEDDWGAAIQLAPTLNQMKDRAHQAFDPIWRHGLTNRATAYRLLAAALGVPEPEAHMAVMSRENLIRTPLICRIMYLRLKAIRRVEIDAARKRR